MGKKGRKERLEMISREPTWAKEVPRIDKRANLGKEFCKDRLGKEGPKDRLEMPSREPTWAKKVQV